MANQTANKRIEIVGVSRGLSNVEKEVRAVGAAQDDLAKSAEASARVTETSARRQVSVAGSYERLRRSLDQTYAAQRRLEEGQRKIDRALEQGIIEANEYNASMALLHQRFGAANDNASRLAERIDYLRSKFDAGYASARQMDAELAELAEAERLGIQVTGGYASALDGLVRKYDAAAQAAERQARQLKELAAAERLAATSADGQARWNQWAGVRDGGAGAARDSAAVFEKAAREAEDFEKRVSALRAQINPAGAALDRMNAELVEYSALAARGAINADELAVAQMMARARFNETNEAIKRQGATLKRAASNFNTSNLAAQGFDIVATAGFMPWYTVALQQGPQVAQVVNDIKASGSSIGPAVSAAFMQLINPISLVTMGVIALGAAGVQWFLSSKNENEKFDTALQKHAETVEHLRRLYGEAAAAAENLASAGGDAFSAAAIRNDIETLRNVLRMQQEAMSQSLSGDGWLAGMFGGSGDSIEMLRNLTGEQTRFKGAVDTFLESIRRGNQDLPGFKRNVEATFSALLEDSANPVELRATADAVLAIGESATSVSGRFAPFAGAINKLTLDFSEGRDGIVEFNREVSRIGAQDPELRKVADEAIVLGANIVKVTDRLKEMERARFMAVERTRDRLASERYDVGQSFYEDRKRQWELEDRILDAQTRQVQALTDQEKIAAAGNLARARNPVEGEERRREVLIAERQERERLAQQARDAALSRARAREEAGIGAEENMSLIGKTVGEVARLQYQYAEMAKLREEAARTGRAASQEEIASIKATAAAVGELAQQMALADVQRDLLFEREQMGRTPIDQRVASEMRRIYGDEYQSHMNDAIAGQIRLNEQWRKAQDELQNIGDIGKDALGGILDILYQSGDATEQLISLFASIGKQFAKMGLDRMLGNVKAGKSIFDLSAFAGAGNGDGIAAARSSAIMVGREIGNAVAPTMRSSFSAVGDDLASNIRAAADVLGISARDLATVISYETGGKFSTSIRGGAGNRHIGLIQFGPAEQQKYGAAIGQTLNEQMQAVVRYLQDRGLKPGMDLLDLYSTINAGRPGLYNSSDAANGGAWGTVADKVNYQMSGHQANADRLLQKQAVSDGVVDANRRVTQSATMQGMDAPGGSGQMGKLEAALGVGGAALGAFFGGYQSGSPLMGGLSGAMSGFGAAPALSALGLGSAAGPIGLIGGAILGVIGGIFGKRKQKKQEREQARAELESQRGAIQSLLDAAMGTPSGEFDSSWRQMSDEIAKARKLASKAGDSALVKDLDLASETFFDFLVDDWRRGLDGVMKAMESGHGMEGAFVRAQKAITDLSDTLVGFVEDAKWFAETGGDYEKAKLTKPANDNGPPGSGPGWYEEIQREQGIMTDAYRVAVERYKGELEKLGIEAIIKTGTGRDAREIAAFASIEDLMKKMESLGVAFDDLGNILTADEVKERADREKELQRAIKDAQEAAQQMALKQLTGADEFTAIETEIQRLQGTAAGLQTTLEKLGMTADEAADAIAKGLTEALAKLRDDYVKDLTRSINELSGAGYINDVMDAMKLYEERMKDSKALGIDTSLAFTELSLSLREISREAGLSGEDLKYLAKLFPDIAKILNGIAPTGGLADAQAAVDRAKADLRAAYDEEARAIESTISRLKSFITSIEKFKASLRLDDQLSPLSPFDKFLEALKRVQDVSEKALAGDETAMNDLEDVSRQYLEEARAYYASSEQYFAIFEQVEAILDQALASAKGQLSTSEQQLVTLKDQVSKLIDIDNSVMTVAAAIAALQSSIEKLDGLGGNGDAFDPTKHWSGALKDFYSQLQTYKSKTGTDVVPNELAGVWSAFGSARSGAEYDLLAKAYANILRGLISKTGMQLGGIVGAYAGGGIVGNGIFDRDSVLARYAGGGNIALAGGEQIIRATSVTATTRPFLDHVNRTGTVPGNDNSAVAAELRALRAEVAALRAERKEGDKVVAAGAQHVASAVESGTRATEDVGRKVGQQGLRRSA